jgi:hypothetical protein
MGSFITGFIIGLFLVFICIVIFVITIGICGFLDILEDIPNKLKTLKTEPFTFEISEEEQEFYKKRIESLCNFVEQPQFMENRKMQFSHRKTYCYLEIRKVQDYSRNEIKKYTGFLYELKYKKTILRVYTDFEDVIHELREIDYMEPSLATKILNNELRTILMQEDF